MSRVVQQTLETASSHGAGKKDEGIEYVSLRLLSIGRVSVRFRKDAQQCVARAFEKVKLRVFFSASRAFSGKAKDVLPPTAASNIVYEHRCCCGQAYIGRTSRFLERIRQHVPDRLLQTPPATCGARTDSTVTRHLKGSLTCVPANRKQLKERFSVVVRARGPLHLEVLEALFIKRHTPGLCQQKDFVRALQSFV